MTRIAWGQVGSKTIETGVSRGVLYVNGLCVPWNGLVSVSESPSGGEVTPLYWEGRKYLDFTSNEDYEGQIECITYPDEFRYCEGVFVNSGYFSGWGIGQQRRSMFNLCYRVRVSNDQSSAVGHKYHLIYNATVPPVGRAWSTQAAPVDPSNFTFPFTTVPFPIAGTRPSSHHIFDSTKMTANQVIALENALYGTAGTTGALPANATEILAILSAI